MKVIGIIVTVLLGVVAHAAEYWVSPGGSDAGAGSLADPFETMQHGVDVAGNGDTVWVSAGTYAQRVEMKSGVRLRAVEGATVILDGSGLVVEEGWFPFVTIDGVSDVVVEGFEMTRLRSALVDRVPVGILVTGAARDVVIRGNVIHSMGTDFPGENGGDAHGIGVFGTEVEAITGVTIIGNELRDLRLGSSEALVVNGNVSGFLVEGNSVTDCNNIGIDVIGHEGTGPGGELDRARDGILRANRVTGISSQFNPAYGGDFETGGGGLAAGGIYVDGGTRILVERNFVSECDIGIELASEHAGKKTDFVTVRNNIVSRCWGGIYLGGYDELRGSTEDCVIRNNSLCQNEEAAIIFQHFVHNCHVAQNAITSPVTVPFVVAYYESYSGNTFDWNLYGVEGASVPVWIWKGAEIEFPGWRSAGFDINGDFGWACERADERVPHITTSQGVNAGAPDFMADEGEFDFRGAPRVLNGRVDVGAFEVDSEGLPVEPEKVKLGKDGIVRVVFRGVGRSPKFWESTDMVTWTRISWGPNLAIYSGGPGWVVEDGRRLDGTKFYRVTAEWLNE